MANGLSIGRFSDRNSIGSVVRGFEITRFTEAGVIIGFCNGVTVEASLIGTDGAGSAGLGNGVGISWIGDGHFIGGPDDGDGNVISGNAGDGIHGGDGVGGHFSADTLIQGNVIGLAPDGITPVPNGGDGIRFQGADFQSEGVAGTNTVIDNTISGNLGDGIDSDPQQIITGNRIGTTSDGSSAAGNGGAGLVIHRPTSAQIRDNTISANAGPGILLDMAQTVTFNGTDEVTGNRIGTASDGEGDLGNGDEGIRLHGPADTNADSVTIGGTTTAGENVIRNNAGAGIRVTGGGVLDTLMANSIDDNAGLGIDDPFTGLVPPTLASAGVIGSTITVEGDALDPDYRPLAVVLFVSPVCDPSGSGEGAVYLGTVATGGFPGADPWSFSGSASGAAAGDVVTAIVRDPVQSSEFSVCLEVAGPSDLELTEAESADPVETDDEGVYTITVTNHGPGVAYPTVVDSVDGSFDFGTGHADASQGICQRIGFFPDTWQCRLGAIPSGGSATVDVHETPNNPGSMTSNATVTNVAPEANPGDESATESTTVVAATTDVAAGGDVFHDTVDPGDEVTYTLTATNNGPKTARGVGLAVEMPEGAAVTSVSGNCEPAGVATYMCHVGNLGILQPGESGAAFISARLFPPGTRAVTATVTTESIDTDPGNDTTEVAATVVPQPGVTYIDVRPSGFGVGTLKLPRGTPVVFDLMGPGPDQHQIRVPGGLISADVVAPAALPTVFKGAGTYLIRDLAHGTSMTINVPMKVSPASGHIGHSFTLTWASGAPGKGRVFDVQIKRPGTSAWVFLKSDTTLAKMNFLPDATTGTYSFRARLRKSSNGNASGWSAPVSIAVT